jgi:hypothetical protein
MEELSMPRGKGIQTHHLVYADPEKGIDEVIVIVHQPEHYLLTRIGWTISKKVSRGFLKSLKMITENNWERAEEL